MTERVIQLLATLVLASNILFAFIFLVYLGKKTVFKNHWKYLQTRITKSYPHYGFAISLTAMLGSLFLSDVALLPPCKLCWYQRILMYPIPFLTATAFIAKARDVTKYILVLSGLGLIVAGYHYLLQMFPNSFVNCTTVGFSVSCSERFFAHFGFITIPWMAFSAFGYLFVLSLLNFKTAK